MVAHKQVKALRELKSSNACSFTILLVFKGFISGTVQPIEYIKMFLFI